MLNKKKKAQIDETKNQRFLSAPIFPKTKKETKQVLHHYNFLKKNRKAQIGETMNWIIATIIIIVLLIFFIYTSSLFGKAKKVIVNKDSILSKGYSRTNDLVLEKSIFTYFLIKDENKQEIFYNELKTDEEKFYMNLDEKIEKIEVILNG